MVERYSIGNARDHLETLIEERRRARQSLFSMSMTMRFSLFQWRSRQNRAKREVCAGKSRWLAILTRHLRILMIIERGVAGG
jgi:hypothetical protein